MHECVFVADNGRGGAAMGGRLTEPVRIICIQCIAGSECNECLKWSEKDDRSAPG